MIYSIMLHRYLPASPQFTPTTTVLRTIPKISVMEAVHTLISIHLMSI